MKNRIKQDINALEVAISNIEGVSTESKYSGNIQTKSSIITLPPNILSSGIIGNITGNSLYNYISNNSDLSNGISTFGTLNSTISVNNKIMQVSGTNNKTSIVFYNESTFSGKWFLSARIRVTNTHAVALKLMVQTNSNGSELVTTINNPVKDKWYNIYGIINIPIGNRISQAIQIAHEYPDGVISSGQIMEVDGDYFRGGGIYAIPISGTMYESWSPLDIFSILGNSISKINNTRDIRIISTGSNLFDGTLISGSIDTLTGANTVSIGYRSNFIRVVPNTQYRISGIVDTYMVFFYNKNRDFIKYDLSLTSTPNDAYFMKIRCNNNSYIHDIMINVGIDILPYDDYNISELHCPVVLNSLTDIIYDEYTFDGTHIKRVGCINNATGTVNYDDMSNGGKFIAVLSNKTMQCGVKNDTLLDIAEKLYYQLSSPIITKYTGGDLIIESNGTIYIDHVYKSSCNYNTGVIVDNMKFRYIDRVMKINIDGSILDITDRCILNVNKNGFTCSGLSSDDILQFMLVPELIGLYPTINYNYPTNMVGVIESHSKNIKDLHIAVDTIITILDNPVNNGVIPSDINVDGGTFN